MYTCEQREERPRRRRESERLLVFSTSRTPVREARDVVDGETHYDVGSSAHPALKALILLCLWLTGEPQEGIFVCALGGLPLFLPEDSLLPLHGASRSGWPGFRRAVDPDHVVRNGGGVRMFLWHIVVVVSLPLVGFLSAC